MAYARDYLSSQHGHTVNEIIFIARTIGQKTFKCWEDNASLLDCLPEDLSQQPEVAIILPSARLSKHRYHSFPQKPCNWDASTHTMGLASKSA